MNWRMGKGLQYLISVLCMVILAAALLPGCGNTGVTATPTNASITEIAASPSPTLVEETPLPTLETVEKKPTSTLQASGITRLIIWVPPIFDPEGGTKAGRLLAARLQEYMVRNPQIDIIVRVKAESGASNLLESLGAANAAAPDAVPSLIALSREDLETAAIKGYIYPVDDLSMVMKSGDWYNYSRDMSRYDGNTYGIPFAGNFLLFLYRPAQFQTVPVTWEEILAAKKLVAFPAADPSALFTLSLYQSLGGELVDDQQRPILQPDVLKEVLKLYADGTEAGVFADWLSQYSSDNQVWEVFRDERADLLVTWSSSFLTEIPADSTILPLPRFSAEAKDFTIADGWLWAFCDEDIEKRKTSIQLAEYLVESGFLADWSEEAAYVPPRPSALGSWANKSLVTILSQIAVSAEIQPSSQITVSVGPVLQGAVQQMIDQQGDPGQAAQAAAEQILAPTY